MKCVICKHGETAPGLATVPLQRGKALIVFRDVPAHICENCGEYFLDEHITAALLASGEAALREGVEVDIRRFVAA